MAIIVYILYHKRVFFSTVSVVFLYISINFSFLYYRFFPIIILKRELIYQSILLLPIKNKATVPGPVCEPIVVPTE